MLEDARKLADLKVENDDVLAMCYKNEGERGSVDVRVGGCRMRRAWTKGCKLEAWRKATGRRGDSVFRTPP